MKRSIIIVFMVLLAVSLIPAQGMMGFGSGGPGMMGGGFSGASDLIPPGTGNPLTIDQAIDQAGKYLASWNYGNLVVSEVTEFTNHFYVEIGEKESTQKAFELLMNKYTGSVSSEPGPNMMWNQKYGPMANGMMGGFLGAQAQAGPMPITESKAHELAQQMLDRQGGGLKIEEGADRFYGYYTLHVLKDGKTFGMLGVNGYSGQVWYHNWHGMFIDNKEVAEANQR